MVTQGVVDFLEAVEVEHHDEQQPVAAVRLGNVDERSLERRPVRQPGEGVLSCLAFDPLVQQPSPHAGRQLLGQVPQLVQVVGGESLGTGRTTGDDHHAGHARLVADRRDHDLADLASGGSESIEGATAQQRHVGGVRVLRPLAIQHSPRQLDAHVAEDLLGDGCGTVEHDQRCALGAQDVGRFEHTGTADLRGFERLAHAPGESMNRIEVAEPLVEHPIGLDDVPQHAEWSDRQQDEPRRHQRERQDHPCQRGVHEEQPPGEAHLRSDTTKEIALVS